MESDIPRQHPISINVAHGREQVPYIEASEITAPKRRSSRTRLVVFLAVFILGAVASVCFSFLRAPIYQTSARLQITPARASSVEDMASHREVIVNRPQPSAEQGFLVEVQVLTSRPLLEKVVQRLTQQGLLPNLETEPVLAVQSLLSATPLNGTGVVQLKAEGGQKQFLADLVNTTIQVYTEQQINTARASADTQLQEAKEEVRVLEDRVATKRRSVEAFRIRSNIVSGERDENQVLSRIRGLSESLNAATDKEAIAAGKLKAIEQAIASGGRAPQARDNPTVANLEQRLSQMQEEWRALERQFKPEYLQFDSNAKSLRTRIHNLEQQLETERAKSHQHVLAEAKEELASATAASTRLRDTIANEKQSVNEFSRRFAEYKNMSEELQGLERMRQAATQRLVNLEASEQGRKPRIQVIELAAAPREPWRPLYWRDAGIGLAGSLFLGLLSVWFVEFLTRREEEPRSQSYASQQPWIAVNYTPGKLPVEARGTLPSAQESVLLAKPLPRELRNDEVDKLIKTVSQEQLPPLLALLLGLTVEELLGAHREHVDVVGRTLRVQGESARVIGVPDLFARAVAALQMDDPSVPLMRTNAGRTANAEDVALLVATAAYDAMLDRAEQINPDALRNSYITFLIRQGIRFADLAKIVGKIPSDAMSSLSQLAPDTKRVTLDQVELFMPALRAG